jgi:RNA polymerase sigma factor (sigma-70 family)
VSPSSRLRATGPDTGPGADPPDEAPPTVFVVDDDESFARGLERMLRASGYAVRCFTSAADFLAHRPAGAAGCIVADLKMPGMDGMSLQLTLARSDDSLPMVFLTGHGDIPTSVTAMRRGAEDFLTKTAPRDQLLRAIERALARDARERLARAHRRGLQARFSGLTPREREVLAHVLRGQLNKQIAADLGISERSVKRHRTSLMEKLRVESVAALTRLALEAGIDAGEGPAGDG